VAETSPELARILDKIKKLLALSKSSNPHEAALAAEKAQELMFAHHLTMAEVELAAGRTDQWSMEEIHLGTMGSINWKRNLFTGVAQSNFCHALWYSCTPTGIAIGRLHNVKLVHHLYEYLHCTIDRLADSDMGRLKPSRENGTSWKMMFCMGASDIVIYRLWQKRQALEEGDPRSRALVPVEDAGLKDFLDHTFPNCKHVKAPAPKVRPGYVEGVQAGKRIRLDDAIETAGGRQQLAAAPLTQGRMSI
jgi:hypothetical protein